MSVGRVIRILTSLLVFSMSCSVNILLVNSGVVED